MENLTNNPFAVLTPEGISAEDTVDLFVDVFTDFFQVINSGHTFLNGPRGSGKSMMFRYMLPDCQQLERQKPLQYHDYFAVYVPIKKTSLNTVDLNRIQKHANFLLNEHLLVTYISRKLFNSLFLLLEKVGNEELADLEEVKAFYDFFKARARESGYQAALPDFPVSTTPAKIFKQIEEISKGLYTDVDRYVKILSFTKELPPYGGSLCEYLEFLYPLLEQLKRLKFMPKGPIFLLIDDADNLSLTQTTILNSWVSQRTTEVVSLKISTQLNYPTFRTTSGITIDAPHDFHEVNIATVYTSKRSQYRKRISAIVEKRLENFYGRNIPAETFFPEDEKQMQKIQAFAEKIKSGEIATPNGYREGDKSYRYATSEYLKSLRGKSKSGMTFRYAGFRDMVDMSSGIIRHFLELASRMYSDEQSIDKVNRIDHISVATQNNVIRDYSTSFLQDELDKLAADETAIGSNAGEKLKNLINSMGGIFQVILYSEASQRRVFSIALTNTPDPEIASVLKLGVRYGYLQESTISTREGTGRTKRYTLSRRLAPSFQLIAASFAGDQFITNTDLKAAMSDSKAFVAKFKRTKAWLGDSSTNTSVQKSLFSEEDE